ncbi:MAG: hypothetical protein LBU65_07625, partial [Planctomycetaceae bacterium]|nr:hypothetical protein [Planctomycetaceae bacterium]
MRRTTVLICLTSLIVTVLLSCFGLAADWNIVTYNNNARANGDDNVKLYLVLENINLVNGDRLLFNDDLSSTYYGTGSARAMNGVDNARGILIKNGSIQFLNGMGDKQRDRIISSTPSNSYTLLNVTWYDDTGNITAGHLRVSDLGINSNTSFTFSNGLRAAASALPQNLGNDNILSGRANYGDTTVEGYTGAGEDDTKIGVDGGGALRVVGFNDNIDGLTGTFTPGANFGVNTTFSGNKATGELRNNNTYGGYGGAIFVKDVGNAINAPLNYDSAVTFEKRAAFANNQATYDGGAIYVTENGMLWFLNNESYTEYLNDGYIQNGYAHTRTANYGASFVKNTAGNSGGALAISSNGYVSIQGGSIYEDNKALGTSALPTGGYEFKGEGGAIFVRDDAELYISDSASFRNNTASVAGGAISIRNNAQVTISGEIQMFGNHATGTESVLHRNGPQIELADDIERSDPYIGPTQLYPVRPAAGYGGAVYVDNGTLTMYDIHGSIGVNSTGTYVPNTHGNAAEKTANGIYMNTNATWNIQPGRNRSLNIYDPILSRGLEQIEGPANEDWSLREHNNVINIDGHYSGRVNVWNDSSDSAFLPANYYYSGNSVYDDVFGGNEETYIDGTDIYSVGYFNVHYQSAGPMEIQRPVFTYPEDGGPPTIEWVTDTVVGTGNTSFSVSSQYVAAEAVGSVVMGLDNVPMRLVRLQDSVTLENVNPSIVTAKMQGENIVGYELVVEGNTLTIAPNAVVALGIDGEAVTDENPLVYYNITLNSYFVPTASLSFVKGDIATGYYGDLNILNGIFTLKNGATAPAGMEVKPTEFGSNRDFWVWRVTDTTSTVIDQTNSGSLTIGHGNTVSDNAEINPDGTIANNLEDFIGSAGLVADPQKQATLWLEKYTGPGGGYTTFRTNNITMNGGRIAMTGIDAQGNISPTVGDDTAKIYTATYGIYLQAPDAYTGTGYGGTFDIGDQQEYSLHHALYGDGSFTKAGNGLLIFADAVSYTLTNPSFPYGDIFAHQAWRPDSENDVELIGYSYSSEDGYSYSYGGIIQRSDPHHHLGLTIVSGGTLQMSQNNILAMVRTYGFCEPDAPDPGGDEPHPVGDYWH